MKTFGTLLILGAATLLTPAGSAEAALTACNTLTASQAPPSGYGSAFNVVQGTAEALVSVACDGSRARVTVGTTDDWQYAYRLGYLWRDGSWQRFELAGDDLLGDNWYTGPARRTITLAADEQGTDMYVVGYVCTWTGSEWKCGCRDEACRGSFWQLQRFKEVANELPDNVGQGYSGPPLLQGPTSYTGPRGARIALLGAGFGSTNQVTFTDRGGTERTVATVGSSQGGSRTGEFTVPDDLPYGMHRVSVRRGSTASENETFFIVTRPGAQAPVVTSISPQNITQGTTITIRGRNFTPQNNDVLTSYGVFRNLPSSDGTTLRFEHRIAPDEPLLETPRAPAEREYQSPTWMYVRNDNGLSAEPGQVQLSL
ncbi:hypothetical protein GVX82_04365 [Patescibacteria group bacterium]|jgi:hypothetical protein|nr:hypothetical protein [Patescibacteria group bacterium]